MSYVLEMVFKKGILAGMRCLIWVSCRLRSMKSVLKLLKKSNCEITRGIGMESALVRLENLSWQDSLHKMSPGSPHRVYTGFSDPGLTLITDDETRNGHQI